MIAGKTVMREQSEKFIINYSSINLTPDCSEMETRPTTDAKILSPRTYVPLPATRPSVVDPSLWPGIAMESDILM